MMSRYVLFACVNGAGKTTLYHVCDELQDLPRINVDEIVRVDDDWNNPADVTKAEIKAVR